MASRIVRFSILAALLGILALSILLAFWHTRAKSFSVAYERVQVGDTRAEVVKLFGDRPDEVTSCNDSYGQFRANCGEIYWYFSFLERWEILFDRDGRVIDKGHNALF
jgi:hypothetical protein